MWSFSCSYIYNSLSPHMQWEFKSLMGVTLYAARLNLQHGPDRGCCCRGKAQAMFFCCRIFLFGQMTLALKVCYKKHYLDAVTIQAKDLAEGEGRNAWSLWFRILKSFWWRVLKRSFKPILFLCFLYLHCNTSLYYSSIKIRTSVLAVVVPRLHTEPYIIVGRVSTLLLIYQTDVSLPSND